MRILRRTGMALLIAALPLGARAETSRGLLGGVDRHRPVTLPPQEAPPAAPTPAATPAAGTPDATPAPVAPPTPPPPALSVATPTPLPAGAARSAGEASPPGTEGGAGPGAPSDDGMEIPEPMRHSPAAATLTRIGMDGVQAFNEGKFEAAREAYRRVLDIDPDNVIGLVNLGATEFRLGNHKEAERLLRRSLELRPDNPSAWLNVGIIYLEEDRAMEALAAIAQAVVYAPNDPTARNYLGVAAGRNGWFDAAESELRRAIELRPNYADAHFNLAVFCLERDPPALELARRHYHRALELGSEPDKLIEAALKKGATPN